MSGGSRKQCVVAYAARERQYSWIVDLPLDGTVADAIEAARRIADLPEVPWDGAPVGIFGESCRRSDRPAHADRIELYRPLRADPRDQRRARLGRPREGG